MPSEKPLYIIYIYTNDIYVNIYISDYISAQCSFRACGWGYFSFAQLKCNDD